MPPYKRVEKITQWLDGSAGVRPDFLSLYIEQVDKAGHEKGPESYYVIFLWIVYHFKDK